MEVNGKMGLVGLETFNHKSMPYRNEVEIEKLGLQQVFCVNGLKPIEKYNVDGGSTIIRMNNQGIYVLKVPENRWDNNWWVDNIGPLDLLFQITGSSGHTYKCLYAKEV